MVLIWLHIVLNCMGGSRKICQRGPTLTKFFFILVDEGSGIQIPGHHRAASETLFNWFRWRANDGLTLNAGLVAL